MDLTRVSQSWIILILLTLMSYSSHTLAQNPGETPTVFHTHNSLYQSEIGDFGPVRPGIEVLLQDSIHLVSGKKVGLITNHTGVDSSGRSSIDLIFEHPKIKLVALFTPEHGIRGTAQAGELIENSLDGSTGVPIYSLYGKTRRPTNNMLVEIETLIFDIQDIGARYYTYVSTMTLAMEAASERGIPIVILDRPNPIGGAVQGNILKSEFATFVGRYPIAMRHGMTLGELARFYKGEFGIKVNLHVVPVSGWKRSMSFVETGLPWIQPSPNIPSIESALHYPGICLFEGTNISVGRGTDMAFQRIGAPWLDGEELARIMNRYNFAGVEFKADYFTPVSPGDGKFDGTEVSGVLLNATSSEYDPTEVAVALLAEALTMSGNFWEWREGHFDRLAGTDQLRGKIQAGIGLEKIQKGWENDLINFIRAREMYLIYP